MKRHFTRLSVLSVFFILCMNTAFAQNINVQGTVSDAADNLPLPGVSVVLKGTKTGTLTDASGKYVISAPATGTLVFTYVGYTIQEIPLNNRTALNVSLSSSSQELDAVVVVGYGTQRRSDLTGSVASVKEQTLRDNLFKHQHKLFRVKLPGFRSSLQVNQTRFLPSGFVEQDLPYQVQILCML